MRITTDFHAAKDISSDLAVSNDVVDITDWYDWMDINIVRIFTPDSRLKRVIDADIEGDYLKLKLKLKFQP